MYSSTVIDDKSTIHRIFPVRWKNYIVCTSDLYCFFFRNETIIQASIFVHRSKSTLVWDTNIVLWQPGTTDWVDVMEETE